MELRELASAKYEEIFGSAGQAELQEMEHTLSSTLQSYVPDSSVVLEWSGPDAINIPLPLARVKLLEDGYESTVERTGHGLQRAFILAMLQTLASVQAGYTGGDKSGTDDDGTTQWIDGAFPTIVLAIEEPELYQHPSRQRHLARVLSQLASGSIPGVTDRLQVIYTTHSPLFVGLDRFENVRVLRKTAQGNMNPKATDLVQTDLNSVATELALAQAEPTSDFSGDALRARLQAIMSPILNEGFFADLAVLVEGESDHAAILAAAESQGQDLDGAGIAVIPCIGKNNLDKPLIIFRKLNIPTYVIWDGRCQVERSKTRRQLLFVEAPWRR